MDFAPAIFMLALISLESTSMMSASQTGEILIRLLHRLVPDSNVELILHLNGALRKVGHFVGYGLLSAAMFRGFSGNARSIITYLRDASADLARTWHFRFASYSILTTMIVALADEIHQSFLPLRGGAPLDFALDSSAAISAQIFIYLWLRTGPSAGRSAAESEARFDRP